MPDIFENMVALVKKEIPGFEVRYKNEHLSSKVLGVLAWIFNRRYMTDYTTTRYPHVYFPSRDFVKKSPTTAVKILAHELVHLVDRKRKGIWFSLSYALPQLAALVFLLVPITVAFVQPWWVALLTAIPALVCATPLPAYWRMQAELRGYSMSMAVNFWRYGSVTDDTMKWIAEEFTGWSYYKMWPYEKDMTRRLAEALSRIEKNQLGSPYFEVRKFVKEQMQ